MMWLVVVNRRWNMLLVVHAAEYAQVGQPAMQTLSTRETMVTGLENKQDIRSNSGNGCHHELLFFQSCVRSSSTSCQTSTS